MMGLFESHLTTTNFIELLFHDFIRCDIFVNKNMPTSFNLERSKIPVIYFIFRNLVPERIKGIKKLGKILC